VGAVAGDGEAGVGVTGGVWAETKLLRARMAEMAMIGFVRLMRIPL
jgi:hypothetical protein